MKELDIEISCSSVETSSSYGDEVTVNLNGVSDMNCNEGEILKRFIDKCDYDEISDNVQIYDIMSWIMPVKILY